MRDCDPYQIGTHMRSVNKKWKNVRALDFFMPLPPLLSLNFFFFLFASNMKSIDHNEYVFYCGQYVREKKARACPPAASTTYIIITLLGAKKKRELEFVKHFFSLPLLLLRTWLHHVYGICMLLYVHLYTQRVQRSTNTHIHLNKLCAVETRVTLAWNHLIL